MQDICGYLFRLLIGSSCAIVLLSPYTSSAATCEKPIAKIVSVQGTVEAQRVGETEWQPAKLNATYCTGDTIWVKRRGRAEVALAKSVLRLKSDTIITIKGTKKNDTALINLLKGSVYFFSVGSTRCSSTRIALRPQMVAPVRVRYVSKPAPSQARIRSTASMSSALMRAGTSRSNGT